MLLFAFVLTPVVENSFDPIGISFEKLEPNLPAEEAGLNTEDIYNKVNDVEVTNAAEFIKELEDIKPGNVLLIGNDEGMHEVVATNHPEDESKGYIGVNIISRFANDKAPGFTLIIVLIQFLNWFFILSLGLGLANLLPLGPVDGGRMYQLACRKFFGAKKGDVLWMKTAMVFLIAIVILLFVPIFKAVFI